MRKKYAIILIVMLSGLTTWFTIRHNRSGTSDKTKTDFAVENTDDIDKIFISNKQEGHVLLEKKKWIWYVNGRFEASKPTMDFFLNETIKKIRVLGPVPLAARKNVISAMAATATKIEIYIKGELEKVYYVGQPTNDMRGTYMYLQDTKDPYITNVPGFEGFLTSRYAVQENEWVSKVVFDYKPEEIKSIDLNYPGDVNASFTISRKLTMGDFDITASVTAASGNLNYAAVKSYFGLFRSKNCEGFAEFDATKFTFLLKSTPYCVVTVKDYKNKTTVLKVYRMVSTQRDKTIVDNDGNPLVFDPTRFNVVLNNEKRVMVIQDIVFGPIMIKYSDFFLKAGD